MQNTVVVINKVVNKYSAFDIKNCALNLSVGYIHILIRKDPVILLDCWSQSHTELVEELLAFYIVNISLGCMNICDPSHRKVHVGCKSQIWVMDCI